MTRDNVWVWKQARANVPGLPDCPLDLAEPEYAVLCFEKHCTVRYNFVPHFLLLSRYVTSSYFQGCIRNVPSHHIWGARVRLCKRCIDSTWVAFCVAVTLSTTSDLTSVASTVVYHGYHIISKY